MEWRASQSHTKAKESTTSATSFLKRRHDDAFPEDIAEGEETSPSKKRRPSAPEILPRIHNLHSPRREFGNKRHPVSDRNHKRKMATEKALVQSYQQIGLLQATTLSNIGVNKNHPLLQMAHGPSHYREPSEYLVALPIAQTPDLWDVSATEDPELTKPVMYAVLEDGKYRFNLDAVAYELADEVLEEEEAHYKWLGEVNRSIADDIDDYVRLNPKYHYWPVSQRKRKVFKLSRWKDDNYSQQWHETCKDIPFNPPDDRSLETQLAISIAKAAHLNPLPTDVTEDAIEAFVGRVQRKGIEYHRAHNRRFLYLWKERVKRLRIQDKYRTEQDKPNWQPSLGTPQKQDEHAESQSQGEECSPPRDLNMAISRSPATQAAAIALRATLAGLSPCMDILPTVPYPQLTETEHVPSRKQWYGRFVYDASVGPDGDLTFATATAASSSSPEPENILLLTPSTQNRSRFSRSSGSIPTPEPAFVIDPLLLSAGRSAVDVGDGETMKGAFGGTLDLPDLTSLPQFDGPWL